MILELLRRRIRLGSIHLELPDGTEACIGDGEPSVRWRVRGRRTLARIARDPELALGETYMEGLWNVPEGRIVDLLEVLLQNADAFPGSSPSGLAARAAMLFQQFNRIARSYRNASHHYDLDGELFRTFLDEDLHYSCAYFARPDLDLAEAQRAKCELIRRKLRLAPDQRVLDVGCGWGGLAIHLAECAKVRVTGITLSREQLEEARARAAASPARDRLDFRLADYREQGGRFDRVVSVGMFEHVGRPFYGRFFSRLRELLTEDGVGLIHTIGSSAPPSGRTNAWIRRYIFPGGAIPSLSEAARAIEDSGLITTDVDVLRLHYAETLRAWNERFQKRRDLVRDRLGERFCRMWEFYLQASEASFRFWGLVVFQIQLARRNDSLPLTRDYMVGLEAAPATPLAQRGRRASSRHEGTRSRLAAVP